MLNYLIDKCDLTGTGLTFVSPRGQDINNKDILQLIRIISIKC